ncbi:MAG: hypothetical protein HUJ76_05975, partial [Parasporobacterium sp.]|nr:hypothetical protein [Parasporobacterium sp.]
QGVSMDVRMILEAIMLSSEDRSTPNNYSDALIPYEFSMRYGCPGEFRYTTLIVPSETIEESFEMPGVAGLMLTRSITQNVVQKSGEPFTVYCIVWNDGGDDVTTVQVKDGEKVVYEKIMAVEDGSWRIAKMDVILDGTGEHCISVGDMTEAITVE